MLAIPSALKSKFDENLRNRSIPTAPHQPYQKWLRYYLDFCQKYRFAPRQEKSLPPFLRKLQDKQQSERKREQAAAAITLYYYILKETGRLGKTLPIEPAGPPNGASSCENRPMPAVEMSASQAQAETYPPPISDRSVSPSEIKEASGTSDFSTCPDGYYRNLCRLG